MGILLAYIRKTNRTHLFTPMWAGVAVAIAISLGFGALLTFGPQTLTFEAQEAIGGSLSIISVGFVTWMIFWMAENARLISAELKEKLDAAQTSAWAVILLAALSVGREGFETTLFIWSATRTAGTEANATPMLGALVGIAVAVLMTWAMMRGVMRINLSRFFTVTGAFLVIVAAGVLSYGIHDLQEAGILPGLNTTAFESYRYIDPSGFIGTLLKAVFNLSSTTTWFEAGAWVLYVGIVMPLFIRAQRPGLKSSTSPRADKVAERTASTTD